ncbi:MAG: tetratricopeptide repeat protein [Blastocatellia bacterium]|nr:tetratricopeptide repeat protein [Blastocatellia bacterium]
MSRSNFISWFRAVPAFFAGSLCVLLFALACASAQDSPIDGAEEELRQGKYVPAIATFTRLIQTNPNDGRAQKGLLRAWLETGLYKEAEREARRFAAAPQNEAQARLMLGEALAATGRYPEAIAEFDRAARAAERKPEPPPNAKEKKKEDEAEEDDEQPRRAIRAHADLRRAELLKMTGRETEAQPIFESFVKFYDESSGMTAEELTLVARALVHLEKFKDANDIYDEAISEDETYIEAHLSRGELFTAKYNYGEAAEILAEAAKINPNSPRLHLAIAANKRIEGGDAMNAAIAQALKVNPNYVEARTFAAMVDLEAEKFQSAASLIDEALRINPNSLEAHTLRASMAWLQNRTTDFESETRATLAINPRYGLFYEVLAHFATQTRRYKESVAFLREAVKLSPRQWSSHLAMGTGLLRLGSYEEGRAAIEESFAGDPFNIWAKNTLDLLDSMKEYRDTRSGDFLFRIAPGESDVLSQYASELMAEAQKKLTSRYQFTPKGPISVEIFPSSADFSVRALGLTGLGALGVCFGQVIAQDSPTARPGGKFNWGSTMWHEYAHVITLQTTDHLIPRWFSEGLSVYEEHKARPGWGDDWNIGHIKAFSEGKWFTIANLDNGFIRPKRPEDIGLAYFEASQICHFVEERYGFNAIIEMLRGYREKKKTPEILLQTLKLTEADFDREFNAYVKSKIGGYVKTLEPLWKTPITGQVSADELVKRADEAPGDFALNIRAGAALFAAGNADKAIPYLKRSIELFPFQEEDGNAYEVLAEIYEKKGDKAGQAEALDALLRIDENNYDALKKLAQLKLDAGDKARALELLQMSFYVNPFEHTAHTMAGDLYLERNEAAPAVREFQVALAANPPNPAEAHYNLARAYFASGKTREARRAVLRSLEAAPGFDKAQELLLKITGQ